MWTLSVTLCICTMIGNMPKLRGIVGRHSKMHLEIIHYLLDCKMCISDVSLILKKNHS